MLVIGLIVAAGLVIVAVLWARQEKKTTGSDGGGDGDGVPIFYNSSDQGSDEAVAMVEGTVVAGAAIKLTNCRDEPGLLDFDRFRDRNYRDDYWNLAAPEEEPSAR